jgi:alpha-tubulin suppressor-like RCC1 family protein
MTAVAAGYDHSVAVKHDGTVWSWGKGVNIAVQVSNLTDVVAIAAGLNGLTLALQKDGTVWAWGCNQYGELGNGTAGECQSVPTPVVGLSDVISVAAGYFFGSALRRDGTVWEWGLGLSTSGERFNRVTPVQSQGINGVTSLGAGGYTLAAVRGDGKAWNWQTGRSPEMLTSETTFKKVAVGGQHTLLLSAGQAVLAFGKNDAGQVGNGTTISQSSPTAIIQSPAIADIATGNGHSIAIDTAGGVWTWGSDTLGQLGRGLVTGQSTPAAVLGVSDAVYVSAGAEHSLAVTKDGAVWAWGGNKYGQLGDGTNTNRSFAQLVGELSNVRTVVSGTSHSLALLQDGTLMAWGSNYFGELGDGTNTYRSSPVKVQGLDSVSAIAASQQSLAVRRDGTVWSWGDNQSGKLGLGTITDNGGLGTYTLPTQIPGLAGIGSVAATLNTSYAVDTRGTAWTWGRVGLIESGAPVVIDGLTSVDTIAGGDSFGLAYRLDGSVWGWGSNANGQLGNLASQAHPAPLLSGVAQIAAGSASMAVLRKDGLVSAMGANNVGQLGDGTFAQRSVPGLVVRPGLTGFLNLKESTTFLAVPPALGVPFFVEGSGAISKSSASVTTTTKFNPADTGKSGAVFITASVPTGSALAQSATRATAAGSPHPNKAAATAASGFTLIQLTASGWQTVTNGQLIPYASGVLSDQLAAQTILNGTDTSTLKGAEFCVGYGTTASDMLANGNIRAVATIPGATTTTSCVVGGTLSVALSVLPGWNLLGNPVNQSIAVATQFGDPAKVTSVWKWDSVSAKWQFYAPNLSATELQSYAASQGYAVLSEIQAGDGFWVNAKTQADLGTLSGTAINLRQRSLSSGWNLVATASAITPQYFNLSLSTTPPTLGQIPINLTSLWAWDSAMSNWFFYAPNLEAQGGSSLAAYIAAQRYQDFEAGSKTLGNGVGFWVRRP